MGPAAERVLAARTSGMASGAILPSPTATSVPARLRTIWWRNALASARTSTRSPRAVTARRSRFRVGPEGGCGERQKGAKSCSPTRCRAASPIVATGRRAGRCDSNRAVNGSGAGEVSMRYTYSRRVALRRASNPAGARRASRTTTSGASTPFSIRWTRAGSRSSGPANDATWPEACTPASVRPATDKRGRLPSIRASASSITPCTVRTRGCRAHPRKSVPSYASSKRRTLISRWEPSALTVARAAARGSGGDPPSAKGAEPAFGRARRGGPGCPTAAAVAARRAPLLPFGQQLDQRHRGTVSRALAELEGPRVSALPLRVPGPDLAEQLMDHVSVRDGPQHLAPGVDVAALGERDQVLGHRPDGLRLRLRRLDPAVREQLRRKRSQHQTLVIRPAPQARPLRWPGHRSTPPAARDRARPAWP